MPYQTLDDLPDRIKDLPRKLKEIWRAAFNAAHAGYDPKKDKGRNPKKTKKENREAYAWRVANAAVSKNEGRLADLRAAVGTAVPLFSALRPGVLDEGRPRPGHCVFCGSAARHRHHRAGANGRMAEDLATFGDKRAMPYGKGKRRRKAGGRMMEGVLAGTVALRELVGAALEEQAEDFSFNDIDSAVRAAVREKYEPKHDAPMPAGMPMETPWVMEIFADRAILRWQGKLWAVPYEIDAAGDAELGEPARVRVEYVAVPAGEEE